jgi:hypothetical protein
MNTPKLSYRSDTTSQTYHMMVQPSFGTYRIVVEHTTSGRIFEDKTYPVLMPWRKTIDHFFDVVTRHINHGVWL